MRLSELGELGLLAELERAGLVQGIEHDAAQIGDGLVVTQDSLVEGVHFRREWQSPECIGHRCLARGLSDIAAMGGRPVAAFLSLAVPAKLVTAPVELILRMVLLFESAT